MEKQQCVLYIVQPHVTVNNIKIFIVVEKCFYGEFVSPATIKRDKKINRFQRICGTIRKHLNKPRTDTQMKFYKVVARPTLLYGSETWVTTKRDMTGLEAAEMRFLRSVKGYTRQDSKRSHKKRTRDLWNTRRETQTQTQLDQPS
jgi:hypothetical protein